MSTEEVVLPDAPIVDAGADEQQQAAPSAESKPEEAKTEEAKPQKTPEEKEIARLRRRVDNLTRRLYEGGQKQSLQTEPEQRDNAQQQADSDALSLSRAELRELIEKEAKKLAPTITKQQAEIEQRSASVKGLVKELGAEKFQELTDDLAGVFDQGKQLAILETDNPRALLEYLTDPENADEAERIAGMSDFRAGRALAAIEAKLSAKADKPQASKAPRPVEPVRSKGGAEKDPSQMTDSEFADWRRRQIKARY